MPPLSFQAQHCSVLDYLPSFHAHSPLPLQIYLAPCVAMHGHVLPTSTPIFKPTSLSLFPSWSSLSGRLVLGKFLQTGVLKDRSCEGGLSAKAGTTISVAVPARGVSLGYRQQPACCPLRRLPRRGRPSAGVVASKAMHLHRLGATIPAPILNGAAGGDFA